MQKKLTLRLEDKLITEAKKISAESGKSLSRIVADFFQVLAANSKPNNQNIPPNTRSLLGALKNTKIDENDYKKHLENKYL